MLLSAHALELAIYSLRFNLPVYYQARLLSTFIMCDSLDDSVHPAKRMKTALTNDDRRWHTVDPAHSSSFYCDSLVFDEQPYLLSVDTNLSNEPTTLTQWVPACPPPSELTPPSEMLLSVFDIDDNFDCWAGPSSYATLCRNLQHTALPTYL